MERAEPEVIRVISIDPGTVNMGVCRLAYHVPDEPPQSIEQFLACIAVEHWDRGGFGTIHIPTVNVRFKAKVQQDWHWMIDELCDVVLEKQGSPQSPIRFLCHAIQGFFLGVAAGRGSDVNHTIYLDYNAVNKFRGPWTEALPAEDNVICIETGKRESDPVKRAAVVCCERLLSHMQCEEHFLEWIASLERQHDVCDALVQGVSYLFRKVVWRDPRTGKINNKRTLRVEHVDPDDVVNTLLSKPRKAGTKRKRKSSVRSRAVKRKEVEVTDVGTVAVSSFGGGSPAVEHPAVLFPFQVDNEEDKKKKKK